GASAAAAEGHAVAVAFDHMDAIKRNAEQIGEDLRISGGVAHSKIKRAGDNCHSAVGLKMNSTELLTGRSSHFKIAANAKAAQKPSLLALALAFLKTGIVGRL